MEDTGLKHLLYRCHKCGTTITCMQIEDIWNSTPPESGHRALCHCGSRHISPGNATVWEELTSPSIWRLWWFRVVLPWWRSR